MMDCAVGDAVDNTIDTIDKVSNAPDIKQIHLAKCMKDCSAVIRRCLDESEARLNQCPPKDEVCNRNEGHESKICVINGLECINTCVADAEKIIKG